MIHPSLIIILITSIILIYVAIIIIIMFLYFVEARLEPRPNLKIKDEAKDIRKFGKIGLFGPRSLTLLAGFMSTSGKRFSWRIKLLELLYSSSAP